MASPESFRKMQDSPIIAKHVQVDLFSDSDSVSSLKVSEPTQLSTRDVNHPMRIVAFGEAFKVIVIGNAGVGKSRMTYLFVKGEQPPDHKAQHTMGIEYYNKDILFQQIHRDVITPVTKSLKVAIYDTAGQEKYVAITTGYYRKAMGALVVYSVTDR